MNNDKYIKTIDLEFINDSKEIEIDYLYSKIKLYILKLNMIKKKKPIWFQKDKLKIYNKKIEEYENKIYELYQKLGEELK